MPKMFEKNQRNFFLMVAEVKLFVFHISDELTTFAIPYQENSNKLLITLRKDVRKLNFGTGKTELLGTVEPNTLARFNDGKCDARGRLWTGMILLIFYHNLFKHTCLARFFEINMPLFSVK